MRGAKRHALIGVVVGFVVAGACAAEKSRNVESAVSSSPALVSAADTDDFGTTVSQDSAAGARVISLVPAATEVIFAIGRGNHLVGRTTWDLYPDSARAVPNVGDGIRPNIEVVLAAKPTLVILYATAENRTAAAAFAKAGISVFAIRVDRIADFARLTTQLGALLGARQRARQVIDSVQNTLAKVRSVVAGAVRPTVVWPLWDAPVLVVGQGSFLAELLDIAGGQNTFADLAKPSPEVTVEEIAHRNPSIILASPLSVKRLASSAKWRAINAVRAQQFLTIDTTVVGRPTVTLGMAAVSLAKLLHPELASKLP